MGLMRTKAPILQAGFMPQRTKPWTVRAFLRKVRPHYGLFCPRPRRGARLSRPYASTLSISAMSSCCECTLSFLYTWCTWVLAVPSLM